MQFLSVLIGIAIYQRLYTYAAVPFEESFRRVGSGRGHKRWAIYILYDMISETANADGSFVDIGIVFVSKQQVYKSIQKSRTIWRICLKTWIYKNQERTTFLNKLLV